MAQAGMHWAISFGQSLLVDTPFVEVNPALTQVGDGSTVVMAITKPLNTPALLTRDDSWISFHFVIPDMSTDFTDTENPPDVNVPDPPVLWPIASALMDQSKSKTSPWASLAPTLPPFHFSAVDRWLMTPMEPRQWGFLAIGEIPNSRSLLMLRIGSIIVPPLGPSVTR